MSLYSFWGKFGQRQNMLQSSYITEPAEFFDIITSDCQETEHISCVNDEMVELQWRYKDLFVETSRRTNVVIAAYTTAQARLKLYSYLEQLQTRVLYADTDSIVFVTRPCDLLKPQLGDYLGDLTNEEPEGKITEFVSGGPKNYAYRVCYEHKPAVTRCKVKGITLNVKNSETVNFETLKRIVTQDVSDSVTVSNGAILRVDRELITRTVSKTYKVVFDKRNIVENYSTLPFGF